MLSTKEEWDTYNFLLKEIQLRTPAERPRALQHLKDFMEIVVGKEDSDNELFS